MGCTDIRTSACGAEAQPTLGRGKASEAAVAATARALCLKEAVTVKQIA